MEVSDFDMYARSAVVKTSRQNQDGVRVNIYKVAYALGVCSCLEQPNDQGEFECRLHDVYSPEDIPAIDDNRKKSSKS